MDEYATIGKRIPAKDAPEKVTGQARFTGDMILPGMLYARVLRSPYPHARVLRVDTSEAERLPGVKAVLSKNNAPRTRVPVTFRLPPDRVAFGERVRYVGDEVAAVAAVSEAVAEEALRLIKVEYEELPAIFDPEEAMKADAPLLHEDRERNLAASFNGGTGDTEAGFREADFIFEETFRVPAQRHASMETHCAIASFEPSGRLTVWTPHQAPFLLQDALAQYLGMPLAMVRVIKPPIGGGFGAKLEMLVEHICALLSRMTGRPVRLVLTREEEFTATVSRHACIVKLKIGARKDGTLTALAARTVSNEGAYLYQRGPLAVMCRVLTGTYRCPNTKFEGFGVYTNTMSGGAYRGYGHPQALFALESMMDIVAERCGIDPVALRLKNFRGAGEIGYTGLPISGSGLAECLARGKDQIGWERRHSTGQSTGSRKRGIGMACLIDVVGAPISGADCSSASVRINGDGSVLLSAGTAELGTGSDTTLAQIVAEELGVSADAVTVVSGDTGSTSFDRGAYANRTLYIAGNAVRNAAVAAKQRLMAWVAQRLNVTPEALDFQGGRVFVRASPEDGVTYIEAVKEAARTGGIVDFVGEGSFTNTVFPFCFGAQFAEVEVDTETGQVTLLRLVALQDTGKAINPMVVEGQLEGALHHGIGYALTENPVLDDRTGAMFNNDFAGYMVLTALDMPQIEVGLVETNELTGPFGAKGMGEAPQNATAAAIANAVYNATGIRFFDLPLTPERVFQALQALQ
ncbi:MAG: molybdopterin-dependent oxidoreductase [Chloroflexi bacterium]|nr:molybdopterin-dependent oxidoreductase [Chloroflexota bacterium]